MGWLILRFVLIFAAKTLAAQRPLAFHCFVNDHDLCIWIYLEIVRFLFVFDLSFVLFSSQT